MMKKKLTLLMAQENSIIFTQEPKANKKMTHQLEIPAVGVSQVEGNHREGQSDLGRW